MDGWSQLLSSRCYPVYQRNVVSGPLCIRMEVWPADNAHSEWFYAFQGGRAERPGLQTVERAMAAAEGVLDGHLKTVRRELKSKS